LPTFSIKQELWLCGPASRRVCPSTNAVLRNVRTSRTESKVRHGIAAMRQDITNGIGDGSAPVAASSGGGERDDVR